VAKGNLQTQSSLQHNVSLTEGSPTAQTNWIH